MKRQAFELFALPVTIYETVDQFIQAKHQDGWSVVVMGQQSPGSLDYWWFLFETNENYGK